MNVFVSLLIYGVMIPCALFVSALPRPLELWLGRWLGRFYLYCDDSRKKIARENIEKCLPQLNPEQVENLLRDNFEHYGMLALEILHIASPIPGHYRRYAPRAAVLEGFENWKAAHDKGKGVLFVSAHLANWELMTAVGAMSGIPLTMVTRTIKPEWLKKVLEDSRLSTGVKAAYQPRTLPAIMRALRNKESVGFVLDQYAPPPMGTPVVFFGAKVDTLAAVGSIAKKTGAAIIPVLQKRGPNGRVRVIIEPEVALDPSTTDRDSITQLLATKVENWIRENPAEWLWGHRRFKNAVWLNEGRSFPRS